MREGHKTFWRPYRRGDIVSFSVSNDIAQFMNEANIEILKQLSENPDKRIANPIFVKRIIGLPGEKIEITAGQILINGKALEQKWAQKLSYEIHSLKDIGHGAYHPFKDQDTAIIIPANHYFVLGDNRSIANLDSSVFGFVNQRSILNRLLLVFWRDGKYSYADLRTDKSAYLAKISFMPASARIQLPAKAVALLLIFAALLIYQNLDSSSIKSTKYAPSAPLSKYHFHRIAGVPEPVPFSKGVYTATYETTNTMNYKTTTSTLKLSSDGKGRKVFLGDIATNPRGDSIDDYLTGKHYLLFKKDKEADWDILINTGGWLYDEEWLKVALDEQRMMDDVEACGERLIDGHYCRGYKEEMRCWPPSGTEYWFDKDSGCLILAKYIGGSGSWTLKLTSFSKEALPPKFFEIPHDFRIYSSVQ